MRVLGRKKRQKSGGRKENRRREAERWEDM